METCRFYLKRPAEAITGTSNGDVANVNSRLPTMVRPKMVDEHLKRIHHISTNLPADMIQNAANVRQMRGAAGMERRGSVRLCCCYVAVSFRMHA